MNATQIENSVKREARGSMLEPAMRGKIKTTQTEHGYTLGELINRSETVTDTLKHILAFPSFSKPER